MKGVLFSLEILLTGIFTFAQVPAIDWQKTLGGNQVDLIYSINQTSDGGFILGCQTSSSQSFDVTQVNNGLADFWILKTNALGTIQWQKCIGGSGAERFGRILQTADSGYIIGGSSNSNISGNKTENCFGFDDFWIVKLDSSGNVLWDKTLGGNGIDTFCSIITTPDNGFLVGGTSYSNLSGNKTENTVGYVTGNGGPYSDYWVIKLDINGNIQWQNTIGGNEDDRMASMVVTSDGGYFVGGRSTSNATGDKIENSRGLWDYWVLKLDDLGNILWQRTIGGSSEDNLTSTINTNDGGLLVAGNSSSNISGEKTTNAYDSSNIYLDYWVLKLSQTGEIMWQKTIGGSNQDGCESIFSDNFGNFIISGYSNSNISFDKTENSRGLYDCWIIKIDSDGNMLWDKTLGGNLNDSVSSIIYLASDNSLIFGGNSESSITGDKTEISRGLYDCWIVKLQPESLSTSNFISTSFEVFPNPTSQTVYISTDQKFELLKTKVYNISGQLVFEENSRDTSNLSVDIKAESGIYFMELENELGETKIFKIVKR